MHATESAFKSFSKQVFTGAMIVALAVAGVATVTGGSAEAARVKSLGHGYGGVPEGPKPVERGYNRVTGDHFYTIDANEHANAKNRGGYNHEHGQAFHAYDKPLKGSQPVYRAYNPGNGDHFYTANFAEYAATIRANFQVEGVAFYQFPGQNDAEAGTTVEPVYRSLNKHNGEHFYTTSAHEPNHAVKHGSKYEGIAFYAPVVD